MGLRGFFWSGCYPPFLSWRVGEQDAGPKAPQSQQLTFPWLASVLGSGEGRCTMQGERHGVTWDRFMGPPGIEIEGQGGRLTRVDPRNGNVVRNWAQSVYVNIFLQPRLTCMMSSEPGSIRM
jgi:hypothetical protein